MKRIWSWAGVVMVSMSAVAWGHFQTLIPSRDIVAADGPRAVSLEIVFTHPMEQGPVMNMGRPKQFGVMVRGKKTDLLPTLKVARRAGKTAYAAKYRVTRPGDHVFYVEPSGR